MLRVKDVMTFGNKREIAVFNEPDTFKPNNNEFIVGFMDNDKFTVSIGDDTYVIINDEKVKFSELKNR